MLTRLPSRVRCVHGASGCSTSLSLTGRWVQELQKLHIIRLCRGFSKCQQDTDSATVAQCCFVEPVLMLALYHEAHFVGAKFCTALCNSGGGGSTSRHRSTRRHAHRHAHRRADAYTAVMPRSGSRRAVFAAPRRGPSSRSRLLGWFICLLLLVLQVVGEDVGGGVWGVHGQPELPCRADPVQLLSKWVRHTYVPSP